MNTQSIIDYLSTLSMNNNREWYHANKDDYKKANAEFEKLLQTLILEIGKFDSSILHNDPKDLTFKWQGTPDSAMTNHHITLCFVPIFLLKESCPFLSAIIL